MFRSLFIRRDTTRSSAIDPSAVSPQIRSTRRRADDNDWLILSVVVLLASAVLAIPLQAVLFAEAADHAPILEAAHVQIAVRSDAQEHRVDELNHSYASTLPAIPSEQTSSTSSFTAAAAVGKVFMTLPDAYLPKPDSTPFFDMTISGSVVEQAATTEALPANVPEEKTTEQFAMTSELADATGAIEVAAREEEIEEQALSIAQDPLPTSGSAALPSVSGEMSSSENASPNQGVAVGWLLSRARSLIENGDISGARLILERALNTGDKRAAFFLAETYDPRVLATWKAYGIKGDVSRARALYIQASEGGVLGSRERLTDLQ